MPRVPPVGRGPRRRPRGPAGGPEQAALRALRRAHRQLEAGQYAQAYPTLRRLADGAARRGMPVRAAMLYGQAAWARVKMADPGADQAAWDTVALGQRALHLLANAGRTARAQALVARLLEVLERGAYHEQAVTLRAESAALLGRREQGASQSQPALPTQCPACAAPLRSDEVEWIDAQSAECAYCGSVVRAG